MYVFEYSSTWSKKRVSEDSEQIIEHRRKPAKIIVASESLNKLKSLFNEKIEIS